MTATDYLLATALFFGVAVPALVRFGYVRPEEGLNTLLGFGIIFSWAYIMFYVVARWVA